MITTLEICPVCEGLDPRQRAGIMQAMCAGRGLDYAIWFLAHKPDMRKCWYCHGAGTVPVARPERT